MYSTVKYIIFISLLLTGCVDPYITEIRSTVNVLVVDGTITDLAEPQLIRLNRSGSDPISGFTSSVPLTKATVEVVVDSAQIVVAHETGTGTYQLPSDFQGQVGHAYQLRFTLSNGTRYQSTQQVMAAAPAITALKAQFNPNSLPASQLNGYTGAHDIYLDTQDPASQHNYYRWDWKLWEKQEWCSTCLQGRYSINNVLTLTSANGLKYLATGDSLFEGCVYPLPLSNGVHYPYWIYDYPCRTQCWAIFYSYGLNIFSDEYSNGGLIVARKVAQIPFYQHQPCLVEIRQASLTPSAYRFYKQLQDQTQNTGGVADTPPSVSVGNVQNLANRREVVVGVFTAAAVATLRYWLDRRDVTGTPPGLFEALNGREPIQEPVPPMGTPAFSIVNNVTRQPPYSAVCSPGDNQTPVKPAGWRD